MTRARITIERCSPLVYGGGVKLIKYFENLFGKECVKIEALSNVVVIDADDIKLTRFMLTYNSADYGWRIVKTELIKNDH